MANLLLFSICAAASVANTVAILDKTIGELQSLRTQWIRTSPAFINLISDLTALKTALDRCKEWIDTDVDELDYRLLADLEPLVVCCRILARRIHSEIETLRQDKGTALDSDRKVKSLIKNSSLRELQKIVNHQMSASAVLLAVSECKSTFQQNTILGKLSTRKTFIQVEDDISWLHGERNFTSISSFGAVFWSKVLKGIDFLRERLISLICENSLLDWCGRTVRTLCRARQPYVIATRQELIRNKLIERELMEHAEHLRKEAKIIMLGDWDCIGTFIKSMERAHSGGFTLEQRLIYKKTVVNIVIRLMGTMSWIIKEGKVELNENAKMHAKDLVQEMENIDRGNGKVTTKGASAVQRLWEDKVLAQRVIESESNIARLPPAFIEDLQRITSDDYLPTDADILRLGSLGLAKNAIDEYTYEVDSPLRIFNLDRACGERRKWIHQVENPASVIFFIDLSHYDQVLCEDSNTSRLSEMMAVFESVVNSRWFSKTPIILMLCNFGLFKEQLKNQGPRYFPDYDGGNDVKYVARYLLRKFNQVNRAGLTLYPHFCEAFDVFNTRVVCRDVKEAMSHRLHASRSIGESMSILPGR